MEKTQENANIMVAMLDKLQESGMLEEVVETEATPANLTRERLAPVHPGFFNDLKRSLI